MPKKRQRTTEGPDDPEQSKRFIDAAKDVGVDESEAGADRAFKKVAKPVKKDR